METNLPKMSPWGKVQSCEEVGDSIFFVATSRHGGVKIPKELNQLIPEYLRNNTGWYEEDCDWCIPRMILTNHFKDNLYLNALEIFENHFWREFEKYFDVEIPEGSSRGKDMYLFYEKNKNNYIVTSAMNHTENMVKCYAKLGGKEGKEKIFLVPKSEYKMNFVINLNKHKEIIE